MGPNVLLIVLDTARADAFEPWGAPAGSTPSIAQLASRGSAAEHAYAAASWTVPSHAALFSGMLPRALGLLQAPGGTPAGCRAPIESVRDRWLPEVLRRAGYATAAFSANAWLNPSSGFGLGFDSFDDVDTHKGADIPLQGLRGRIRWSIDALRARQDSGAGEIERLIAERAAADPDRPFFWFANVVESHSPYMPPHPYNPLGPLDRLRAIEDARRHLSLGEIWRACVGEFDVPGDALERMRALYEGAIAALDAWIGRLMERLEDAALLEDTVVIVTSDHGENFGEGGLLAHAFSLDDRLIHVPLVAAGPMAAFGPEALSLASLPRLIGEASGVTGPWREQDLPEQGVAVSQFDPPAPPGDARVRAAIETWGLDQAAERRMTTELTCATDGRFKLLVRGESEELYDLESDPLESAPVAPSEWPAGTVATLRAALCHDATRRSDHPSAAQPPGAGPDAADLEARMRVLGYL